MGRSMATPRDTGCGRCVLFRGAIVLLAAVAIAGCGRGRTVYEATKLPGQWAAAPTENVQTVDLSRLATYSVSNEFIDRGDVLNVTLVTDYGNLATTTTPVRVGEDGVGTIPLIGSVSLAGLELESAEQAIASAAVHRGVFRNPLVTVTMNRQRVNSITVIGAVEEPGVFELPRGSSSLLAALVAAGGLSEDAGPDVEIRRPVRHGAAPDLFAPPPARVADGSTAEQAAFHEPAAVPRTTYVNLVSAAKDGRAGYPLEDGDVVNFTKRALKPIHVLGLVGAPGSYELPINEDTHLLDALALAGGRSSQLADKVWIIRKLPGQTRSVSIQASIREAKRSDEANLRLAPGDIVSVEETAVTFAMDMVRNFVRFGFSSSLPLF